MLKSHGYAAYDAATPLRPFGFERREPLAEDVHIEILYCGVCHSDLHQVRNEWGGSHFPLVPGHEIVGRVAGIGGAVTQFKPGDLVGVGCLVDSCRTCPECVDDQEQYCDQLVLTYNSHDRHSGGMTYGGYSNRVVVDQRFVLKISERLDPAAAAPLLCAGITTWSPLRHWRVGPSQKVGVVGLGGLGHMGVKFAHAFGAEVVLFTTSPGKSEDARRLGADAVVVSKNAEEMTRHSGSFDFILDTVAAAHDLDPYLTLLKRDGTLCLLGVPDHPHPAPNAANLIFKRRNLAGSLIGGLRETQEMLDFCAEHGIVSDIEQIPMQQINTAYQRMLKGDVKYRFVIDLASLQDDH
ncbi:NAD(P)-dependent alcohol dehydrogenase [Candidatus Methylospira mobilis]|uniref:NAD(P)-dependent alcohol dehydrogenase n=1 Tax=Candidatus Methylospira mobilis TaxID=1808979 RepID=A0A5Q0BKE4_9GAMM|nr:NAD(P)-dependent alcohol dehydrogenase [Candidatus Methylospira mobilis]QFY44049.1 NAD(P)-dependent alcohol dehydrogenase [Candidatus Methylospira mobilis]WNV05054.1 NAD(P)-dependent alcohol dehydrogenase [Candidatus Methylospira mobilis]